MNIQSTFKEITQNEPWNEISTFFDEYESFEEIPLVSRYKKISKLTREFQTPAITAFLVNTAFFTLNSAMLFARLNRIRTNTRFYALTFTDFTTTNPEEPPIPHFFIHARESREVFLKRLTSSGSQKNSPELNLIREIFIECHLEPIFSFYESRFFDDACNEEFVRVFAVLRQPYL
ncbi:Imm15 family immunity protein [Pseudomonas sp. B19(2017)]|uniref:Imm15 family immunity protein n=1 Tax=unclassified Pseudomonas TaxID=196821 RepID=UPI003532467F